MNIASQYADVYTDFNGLSQLRAEAANNDQGALRKVAGQFEAMFIQMMLKSMRDAGLADGLMDSDQVKTYQSMFDQQLALDLGRRNSLGLADMLVRQLGGGADAGSTPGADRAQNTASVPRSGEVVPVAAEPSAAQAETTTAGADWRPESPEGFVRTLLPHAREAAAELGTSPQVLIAQAALETGWGQHMIRREDGGNSFNLFGIKADASWQGARALTDTVEFRDGLMRRERAPFRAYGSVAESFADYVDFLKSSPRYREALDRAADTSAFTRALSQAGYATDPDYHDKIQGILSGERLRDALAGEAPVAQENAG